MTWLAVAVGGALGLDTFTLGHGSEPVAASLNVLVQNGAGVALVWAGYTVAVKLH